MCGTTETAFFVHDPRRGHTRATAAGDPWRTVICAGDAQALHSATARLYGNRDMARRLGRQDYE